MKLKIGLLLLTAALTALTAWLVHVPDPVHAQVPAKYRDSVAKGFEFLAKQQTKDGHWEGADGKHPVAVTALVGMTLLMEGSTLENGKYSANLRNAVDWLQAQSQPKRGGLIYSGHPSEADRYMEGHGLATQFLAWCDKHNLKDKARKEKLGAVLGRALQYIAKAQSSRGGWYKTSKAEGHDFDSVSATAIQVRALYMANHREAGVRIETVAAAGQDYMKEALEKLAGARPDPGRNRQAETAAALVCRCTPEAFLLGNEVTAAWFKYCRTAIPMGRDARFGRDDFTHYQYAQALFTLMQNRELNAPKGGLDWVEYQKEMFDHLQSTQNKDGSWPGPLDAKEGICVGPVYTTALWCTVLQLDNRHHPLTRARVLNTF